MMDWTTWYMYKRTMWYMYKWTTWYMYKWTRTPCYSTLPWYNWNIVESAIKHHRFR